MGVRVMGPILTLVVAVGAAAGWRGDRRVCGSIPLDEQEVMRGGNPPCNDNFVEQPQCAATGCRGPIAGYCTTLTFSPQPFDQYRCVELTRDPISKCKAPESGQSGSGRDCTEYNNGYDCISYSVGNRDPETGDCECNSDSGRCGGTHTSTASRQCF